MPRREFLHVDDLADASVFLMEHYSDRMHINVGTGSDVTIRELAEMIVAATGWSGRLIFDASKPDGAPRKLTDVTRLRRLGWQQRIGLQEGIAQTYAWFCENGASAEGFSTPP